MNILIVDDSAVNRKMTEDILRAAGYSELSMAGSAEEMFDIIGIPGGESSDDNIGLQATWLP